MAWSKEVTCVGSDIRGCGTKLFVTESDLYLISGTDFDDTGISSIVCCCPKCGIETAVGDVECFPRGLRPSREQRKALFSTRSAQTLAK